jgi:hypothetical protein
VPITLGRLRIAHLQPVLDKAAAKLAGWQGQLFNLGGPGELVQTVLDSLPTYVLTALKLPKKFFRDIDKIRSRFLWVGNEDLHGGKCKVNWSRVCRPLKKGGHGILDLEHFGRALSLRWLWYKWMKKEVVWSGADLPIDNTDAAFFSATTRVTVHNGTTVKF